MVAFRGNEPELRAKAKTLQKGKDYIMQDADVVYFKVSEMVSRKDVTFLTLDVCVINARQCAQMSGADFHRYDASIFFFPGGHSPRPS